MVVSEAGERIEELNRKVEALDAFRRFGDEAIERLRRRIALLERKTAAIPVLENQLRTLSEMLVARDPGPS